MDAVVLAACAKTVATPLAANVIQIDVSAAPIYGRAGAQEAASRKAAEATLAAGFDRFIVMDNAAWNDQTAHAGSFSSAQVGPYGGYGSGSSYANTVRRPEARMIIKMLKNGEPGSENAIDARAVLKTAGQ